MNFMIKGGIKIKTSNEEIIKKFKHRNERE